MFTSILLAICLTSEPADSIDAVSANAKGNLSNVTKNGNSPSQWTFDARFIRDHNGRVVGYRGVDVPNRMLR